MKTTALALALSLILTACSNQTASEMASETARTASLPAEAPASINEAQYETDFNSYVLPLIAQGETGFFTGVGGKKLFTFRLVHPEAKANVVISHGYGESVIKYRETIYNLFAQGYSVYLWEHRGHGHSDRLLADRYKTHVESFDNYVSDMQTFVSNHVPKDKPLFLLAHSMGGGIAAAYLERNPGVFKAAVLNSPLLELDTNPYPKWISKAVAGILTFVGKGEDYAPGQKTLAPDEWILDDGASTSSKPRFDTYKRDSLALDLTLGGVTVNWLREELKATSLISKESEARKATTPILMFQAGKDTYVKPAGQDRFCAAAPACTMEKFAESRHEVFNEVDSIRNRFFSKTLEFYSNHL